ncbi:shikimate dehydrogenase [Lederbergia galactosidilytica]|uniref:Shikimate dehydrogenase (NADP(+)) n=1 Tax=Lederbergia galactosidilytica TaxID=217031 RepID=A0A0Q9YLL0_9BACI|nr:shikimate dehydrogenase [Lederbergia galactosidilytica]OAK74147.1 shikimate dehydrogenase [Lederbergia galactosidilytica]
MLTVKLYGVIGDPIAHSLSPVMHNREFKELGMEAYYHPFHIKAANLEVAIKGMKAIGVEGFNITIPHKTAIIPFLDRIDPLAQAIGAINTVVRENDQWIGFNTDGEGFMRALQAEWKEELGDERVLIIGAGGAAKAIFYTLLSKGIKHIDICNRTVERALNLIESCPYKGYSSALSFAAAEDKLNGYTLVIQTTSIGMYPNVDQSPLSLSRLNQQAFVSDIIYNPFQTAFLKLAKEQGAQIQNGLGMFVYQGALAFEKWTGEMPNTKRMTEIVMKQLGAFL